MNAAQTANAQRAAQQEEERLERKRRETKEQAERRERMDQAEKMKCHLHKKVKDSCKFCKKYKELLDEVENKFSSQKGNEDRGSNKPRRKLDRAISEDFL